MYRRRRLESSGYSIFIAGKTKVEEVFGMGKENKVKVEQSLF